MTLVDDIKQCTTPQQALILLAQAIDDLREKDADPWTQPLAWEINVELAEDGAFKRAKDEEMNDAQRDADIATVREALLLAHGEDRDALQAKLRLLQDTGHTPKPVDQGKRVKFSSDGQTGEVEVFEVSEARQEDRVAWAIGRRLHDFIPLDDHEAAKAYAVGGPMWLYLGNREAVMAMPYGMRQELVEEIAKDSIIESQEVGRDILKSRDSADRDVTVQAIDAMSGSRGLR